MTLSHVAGTLLVVEGELGIMKWVRLVEGELDHVRHGLHQLMRPLSLLKVCSINVVCVCMYVV